MPADYPDLTTIFSQLGPMAGAVATGQRQQMGLQSQGIDQQLQAALAQKQQLGNQFDANTMQDRQSQVGANLAQTLAGTQGTMANTQGQQLANQLKAGTMDSTIAAGNATNGATTAKGLAMMGQYIGQFGAELEQTPPLQRATMMAGMEKANPGLANSPTWNAVKQMPPEQMPQALQQAAQKLVANSPENQSEAMKQSQQGDQRVREINATGANQMAVENARINAGKYVKNSKANLDIDSRIDMENDPVKKQAALLDAARQAQQEAVNATDPTEKQANTALAQGYIDRAKSIDQLVRNKLAASGAMNTTMGSSGISNTSRGSDVPSAIPSSMNSPTPQQQTIQPGTVSKGYIYKGGDPHSPSSWVKQ